MAAEWGGQLDQLVSVRRPDAVEAVPLLSDELRQAVKEETFAILADSLFPPPQEASPNSDSLSASEINYVHLANAMIYYPNGSVPSKGGGVYWRGRLSAVDGFFFGEIQIEKSS